MEAEAELGEKEEEAECLEEDDDEEEGGDFPEDEYYPGEKFKGFDDDVGDEMEKGGGQ